MILGFAGGTSRDEQRHSTHILYRALTLLFLVFATVSVIQPTRAAAQSYTFNSVKVEGNKRIETSTIVAYTGIAPGKSVTAGELNEAYQRIIDSGVFETVDLEPRGSTLLISVAERPTINRVSVEGNRRIKDEDLSQLIQSKSRLVFNPATAEADAAVLAEAYSQQGRIAATVTPRIIRLNENRVDLVFEISEGDTIEVERISFVGNRAFSDRRLRRVLQTKQAGILRTFIRSDTLIEDRVEFDKQILRDFYLSRGYVDFRILGTNVELTNQRDAFYLVMKIEEGRQFRFGKISTVSEMAQADPVLFQNVLKVRPGVVYSPSLIENSIARMERLGVKEGIDFLRVEPRITRNDREQTLDVEFALVKGPRIFVERIDVEGNTTTLDRIVRQQFRIVEGDPFNPREIRASAERIRALGFFSTAEVETREGSSPDQVIVDVDVAEQPTGSLNLGGAYSVTDGFGIAIGLTENNFLGRGQRVSFNISTAQEYDEYTLGFTEPYLLGRDLRFDLNLGVSGRSSSFATYDIDRSFFSPSLTFPISENGSFRVRYGYDDSEMLARGEPASDYSGAVITNEIDQGARTSSLIGLTYTFDSRVTGLNPNAGVLFQVGADFAGLGGDNKYVKSSAKVIAQKRILNEEVVLRASLEAGALSWRNTTPSRSVDRYILTPEILRGFEPAGVGPRDQSNGFDDAIGGNYYAVARLEADFPLGLPEEIGLRGGVFYDVGNLWGLNKVDTTGAMCEGQVGPCGADGSWRHVIGFSVLWTTGFGPLRFNFSKALKKETFDKEQTFDLTIQARF
ncbi:outer membrane protein assembly factor BamA [Sedimentitalea nanhaiensis]|uniref:Outer membrane protein assembly factor BamA n=1 Tax=Sedimentitalea nanhaiensis TaxID=999627 RepID=A0A1I7DRX8_9RHOB|nr:outer membrane protein assembly factor BamA [Sedimentitalea nanhaiensis]SFU14461.1 Beta-barrel assembly machine subunit BamA [Sedimentitalea nanhaiensis]